MDYTGTAFVALVILLIINYDVLFKLNDEVKQLLPSLVFYRRFLISVIVFYICDTLWGLLYDLKLITLVYVDTMIFFAVMAISVFLWTRYVIDFIQSKSFITRLLGILGVSFLVFELAVVIVNIFSPVLFSFDENGVYSAGRERYVNMSIQLFMFFLTSVYMLIVALKNKEKVRRRHLTIGVFGIVMTIFVAFQTAFPFLALYSVGYMIGTCLLHTFILEDIKEEQLKGLQELVERDRLQREELGSAWQLAYTDSLTNVRNKLAYAEAEQDINCRIKNGAVKELALIVCDLNGLKVVNDTKGHDEGDRYIKKGCQMICKWFKRSPVFRIGGDEFVVILEGEDFSKRKNLLSGFNKMVEANIPQNDVVISTGMDELNPEDDRNVEEVFSRADKKMYERKRILKSMGSL